jgi:WD40 repeat protein
MNRQQIPCNIITALAVVTSVAATTSISPQSVSQPSRSANATLTAERAGFVQRKSVTEQRYLLNPPLQDLTAKANSKSWQDAQLIRTINTDSQQVTAIAITPNGENIVSGGDNGTITVWELNTGKLIRTLPGQSGSNVSPYTIISLDISPNGQTLASAGGVDGQDVKLWNLKTGELVRTINRDNWFVKSVAFSPDGKSLALGYWNTALGKPQIEVLNFSTGESSYKFQGSSQSNLTVEFSPDGKTLVSGNEDSTIQLWDLGTGKLIRSLNQGEPVKAIAFSQNGKTLLSESLTQTLKIWNLETGELISTPIETTGFVFVNAVAFNPKGEIVASGLGGENGTLNLYDLETGKVIRPLTGSGTVFSLAFTPNGKTLVSGNFNGTITIWQTK